MLRAEEFDDRLFVELDGAGGGGALGRGVGELEGLLDLQVGQPLDLEDAAGEDVLLARLSPTVSRPLLDGRRREWR